MKIAIITNYFGKLPSYFQLWLDSCTTNTRFTWLFFSDCDFTPYVIPKNVQIIQISFAELKKRLQSNFSYSIRYDRSWDLCAFRPTFGTIFKKELEGYDFWGYCDSDLVFGNLNTLVPENLLNVYDKIFPNGHLSLVRNTQEINNQIFSHPLVEKAISINEDGLPCFDEVGFKKEICPQIGIRQFNDIPYMNPKCRAGHFVLEECYALSSILGTNPTQSFPNVYTWHNGTLIGYFVLNNQVKTCEIAYCHFFRRKMDASTQHLQPNNHYLIIPNKIIPYDGHPLTIKEINHFNRPKIHWSYFKTRLTPSFIINKLKFYIKKLYSC